MGVPYTPRSLKIASVTRCRLYPLCPNRPGILSPNSAYKIAMIATMGSTLPRVRLPPSRTSRVMMMPST